VTTRRGDGILAIWNGCRPEYRDAFEAWYQREHLIERVTVPGFLFGRRYQSLDDDSRFFACYETTAPDVLFSPAYQARIDAPTPETTRMMSQAFFDMSRTVCLVEARSGDFFGAYAVTKTASTPAEVDGLRRQFEMLPDSEARCRFELWLSAEAADHEPMEEERLRGGDVKIGACLFLEFLRERPAIDAAAQLGEGNVYRFLCERRA
jgi:hypothetical protein